SKKDRKCSRLKFAGESSRCSTIPSLGMRKTAPRSLRRPSKNLSTSETPNMPTPSNQITNEAPPRSVFGNYRAVEPDRGESSGEQEPRAQVLETLQSSIHTAVARTFLFRFLARVFEEPDPGGWQWVCHDETHHSLMAALAAVGISQFPKFEMLASL